MLRLLSSLLPLPSSLLPPLLLSSSSLFRGGRSGMVLLLLPLLLLALSSRRKVSQFGFRSTRDPFSVAPRQEDQRRRTFSLRSHNCAAASRIIRTRGERLNNFHRLELNNTPTAASEGLYITPLHVAILGVGLVCIPASSRESYESCLPAPIIMYR